MALSSWSRPSTASALAEGSRANDDYLLFLERADPMSLTFASLPIWTLDRRFATETLTLHRCAVEGQKVRWSGGALHGSWGIWYVARDDGLYDWTLTVEYWKTPQEIEPGVDIQEVRTKTFTLLKGTSIWIKANDEEDAAASCQWTHILVPLIDQDLGISR